MPFYEFEGKKPAVHVTSFVHPTAVLIGGVTIGENCFIAPGAVIRGDWGYVEIYDGSNIQDNVIIHSLPDKKAILGPSSHIAHGAILHGPILGEHVLVGMGAVIMDGAEIGDECIIGALCFVPSNFKAPARKLLLGVPAKIAGDASEEAREFARWGTKLYQTLPERYGKSMKELMPESCLFK